LTWALVESGARKRRRRKTGSRRRILRPAQMEAKIINPFSMETIEEEEKEEFLKLESLDSQKRSNLQSSTNKLHNNQL